MRLSRIVNGAFAISLRHSGNIIHDIIRAIYPGPLSIILPFKERIRLKLFQYELLAISIKEKLLSLKIPFILLCRSVHILQTVCSLIKSEV